MSIERNNFLKRYRNATKIAVGFTPRTLRLRRRLKFVEANWKRHGWQPDKNYTEAFIHAMKI